MADGVSYGGQFLPLDIDRQIATFVSRRWPDSRWPTSCSRLEIPLRANPFANRSLGGRFALPYPELPAPRLNEVIIPTGASRYGRALFLIGGDQLDALAGSSDASESSGGETDFLPLVIEYNGQRFEWQMAKLTPVLLDATGTESLWLLPLVDRRYFWKQTPASAALQRSDTWADLFASLGTAIGQALDAGTVPAVHGYPDIESFADVGLSAAQAIDAAALSVGLRAVMNAEGTLELKNDSDSNIALDANLSAAKLWAGGESQHHGLPEKVALISRQAFDLFGLFDETAITEAEIVSDANSSGIAVIHTPRWLEHYEGSENADSRTKLTDLAEAIATNITDWGNRQYAVSAPAVAAWTVCGHDDYLAVHVPGVDRFESVSTHVASLPSDFHPIVHLGNADYRLNFSRVRGIAVSSAIPGGQVQIRSLTGMDGETTGITRQILADNTHDWNIAAGAAVRAEYNKTDRVWETYQADCEVAIASGG